MGCERRTTRTFLSARRPHEASEGATPHPSAPRRAGCAGAQQTFHPHVGVAAIDARSAVAATEDKTMKIWPILSFLVPVGALALLGVRRLLGRRVVSREVAALQGLRRSGRGQRRTRG